MMHCALGHWPEAVAKQMTLEFSQIKIQQKEGWMLVLIENKWDHFYEEGDS